ncbi:MULTISPECIES: UTRA domain-containing protein [unclassified Sphingobium]|uniref:UTRA domain-containing protein n=1 Tax=unclassified Sphingobium TaxID=2611147 RepID=UPI0022248A31|nr:MULTISPECIES: UTRA domain-containing protein [unclassified Sphingobium]MCW2410728.1 DNA-binding GntR family transcriptional regulator [Sphingobium sp. B8D3D]MCW2416982.1 DNA-binding GntR family transcriptional regulator [Sphingobium sp. B8D3A]
MTSKAQPDPDKPPQAMPQYLALRDRIAEGIDAGKLPPGTRLPSERQLQTESGAARGTIREALFQLEAEGLIYRRDRSGWYVSPPPVTYDPTRWAGFMTYVTEQGRLPATETLSTEEIPAASAVADIFRVAPGSRLFMISRRRSIDRRPVLVERIMVDCALAPGLLDHDLNGSLTQILSNRYGLSVARNRVDMRPCALVKSAADGLSVKTGTPGLLVVRTSFDEQGRVIEYDQEFWRHDAIRVHVDTSVKPPQS